jgi:5-methyltetrahydrofolate--homocysteine methyltransferase
VQPTREEALPFRRICEEESKGMTDENPFLEQLLTGNTEAVVKKTRDGIDKGDAPEKILQEGLIPAMGEVGEKFRNGEIYIPEVMLAARSMKGAMVVLKPFLTRSTQKDAGKVVIGTVKGDLHDIGKNLVVMMMEGAGYDVIDLGADVSTHKFVESIRSHKPAFVGLSALLTTTMKEMKQTILALEKEELRGLVRVIIGGAPVTQRFAEEIGADGFAPDATSVVAMMKSLA